ncbi:hypothetical protein ACS0TY_030597 [Phlomoides rotata]
MVRKSSEPSNDAVASQTVVELALCTVKTNSEVATDILKIGYEESLKHADCAIFSLAQEDDNETAIGILGALQMLLHELRSGTRRSRYDTALALVHKNIYRDVGRKAFHFMLKWSS